MINLKTKNLNFLHEELETFFRKLLFVIILSKLFPIFTLCIIRSFEPKLLFSFHIPTPLLFTLFLIYEALQECDYTSLTMTVLFFLYYLELYR